MGQQPHRGGHRRPWQFAATVALSAAIPLAAVLPAPVLAQEEIDPTEVLRNEISACIASGTDGGECAAAATLALQALMSGDPDPADAEPAPEGGTAGNQVNGNAGADGQVSNGGDQALSADAPPEPAPEGEIPPAPAETTPVPLVESMAPPPVDETTTAPVESAPPAGGITTTSTTTDTGTTNESTSALTGGAQTHDASGTDGGRHRARD